MTSSVADLLAVRRFIRDCLLGPGYNFPPALALAIDLTDAGERILDEVKAEFDNVAESDIYAAILGCFSAEDDILIDSESSSVDSIAEILSREIGERRINYPLVFGRLLHDQFIDNFGANPIDTLTPEQTQRLVTLTPQGVFQVKEWVSGPFGLLKSRGSRQLAPQSCGPVIRCSIVGCNDLHHIQTSTSDTDAGKVFKYIGSNHHTSKGLTRKLNDILLPDSEFYRVNHPGGLPWLIGNGLTYNEVSIVTEYALKENIGRIRERANAAIGGAAVKRPPTQLVHSLSHAHLLQLLLLLDDVELVEVVETVIEQRLIVLSPTEVRRSFENRHLNGGYFGADAELSRLGIRFVPKRQNLTEPRTLAVIKEVFSGNHQSALTWQLRSEAGVDPLEKLERGLDEQDPRQLVSRILFSSQEALQRTFNVLQYGKFEMPATSAAENFLVDKILWKLGNPLPTPAPVQALLEQHVSRLLVNIATEYPDEEARIVAIRGAGMDMFVELEEVLRSASEFACWALMNDHYDLHPLDRFRFSRKHAEAFSRKIYGDESAKRGAGFPFDAARGNSLSVLIACFRILAEVCESRLSAESEYLRPGWQFPEFASHSDVQQFPLQHTVLFLDLRPDSQKRLMDTLRSVTLALTQIDVCEVRNSLGHPRETFPGNERLAEAVQAIRGAITSLAVAGLMPVIRKYAGENIDTFNRRKIRMADGRGDEIILSAPNQLMLLNLPSYQIVQVIMRDALLSNSLQPARFAVADDSDWSELWHHVGLIYSWLNRSDSVITSSDVDSASELSAAGKSPTTSAG